MSPTLLHFQQVPDFIILFSPFSFYRLTNIMKKIWGYLYIRSNPSYTILFNIEAKHVTDISP